MNNNRIVTLFAFFPRKRKIAAVPALMPVACLKNEIEPQPNSIIT
jgi:hypothetical protein